MVLLFCEWDILPQPLLNLSVYFERYRQEYYDRLLAVSQRGEWDEWIRFFLRGVGIQARDSLVRLDRLQGLRTNYQTIIESERNQGRMEQVLDFLFMRPILSVRQLEEGLGINFVTAKRYIEKLVTSGILQETTGYARNRIFRADDILKAIEGMDE
jgi:Fic family protein